MKKYSFLFVLFAVSIILACGGKQVNTQGSEADTLHFKYAQNIVMIKQAGATIVELKNPWTNNTLLHRYILLSDSTDFPNNKADDTPTTIIKKGNHRAIVCPSAHAALLNMLAAQQQIVGVCDFKYMVSPQLQQLTNCRFAICCCRA